MIKVRNLQDDTYQVVNVENLQSYSDLYSDVIEETVMFQGSLADCEALIRLEEKGYLE